MEIKNQDDGHNWQTRVREYEDVSDTTFSEEVSWKKLRQRLDQAPGRKKHAGYWLAAASVVLLVVITLFSRVSNKAVVPELTKTPALLKQNNNIPVPTDTLLASGKKAANPNPTAVKKAAPTPVDSLQNTSVKKEIVLPSPVDTVFMVQADTPTVASDIVQQPAPLPTVHIQDLIDTEPARAPVSLEGLAVKKMIRLFSIDLTKDQPTKKQEKVPANPYSIPNNQN
ncbi:MAG: hypothetical protein ABIN36_02300 [Ferruginibacter sp.]